MLHKNKLLLILNPRAGKCEGFKRLPEVLNAFQQHGYLSTVLLTEKSGDAALFAKHYEKDYDLIVCIGGDGTFSEVMSGMVNNRSHKPIGYIPTGSSNDYGFSLGLTTNLNQAIHDIVTGKPQYFDIGLCNGKPFAYVAAFGAFVKTSYSTSQDLKNLLGHFAYVLEGIRELRSLRSEHIRIETDGEILEGDYILSIVSNSLSVGRILHFNPEEVEMNDGFMEIMLISMPSSLWDLSGIIQAISSQEYSSCNSILFRRSKRIKITTQNSIAWSLDGEYMQGSIETTIEILHNAIQVILPVNHN